LIVFHVNAGKQLVGFGRYEYQEAVQESLKLIISQIERCKLSEGQHHAGGEFAAKLIVVQLQCLEFGQGIETVGQASLELIQCEIEVLEVG
jgi:hypothetical protein